MNKAKQFAFDPQIYIAWKNLAVAILTLDEDTNAGPDYEVQSISQQTVRRKV